MSPGSRARGTERGIRGVRQDSAGDRKGHAAGCWWGQKGARGRTLVEEHLILTRDSGSMLFYSVSPVC